MLCTPLPSYPSPPRPQSSYPPIPTPLQSSYAPILRPTPHHVDLLVVIEDDKSCLCPAPIPPAPIPHPLPQQLLHLLVVVEDDNHVCVQEAGVVHCLIRHPAGDRAVANHLRAPGGGVERVLRGVVGGQWERELNGGREEGGIAPQPREQRLPACGPAAAASCCPCAAHVPALCAGTHRRPAVLRPSTPCCPTAASYQSRSPCTPTPTPQPSPPALCRAAATHRHAIVLAALDVPPHRHAQGS